MTQLTCTQAGSKHFRLQRLADGVYAALHVGGGAAIGNAGIIDLGNRTLVFDTFFTPQAGVDLRAAAELLTGRPVDMVVNSHYHNDHIWGNQAFCRDTDIISTVETQRLIATTQGVIGFESFKERAALELASTQAQYQATQDERQRRQLAVWIDYHQGFLDAKPTLEVRVPNVTFAERLVLQGTQRSAELIPYVGGHGESDCVLYLPQEGIVFMSDLLFIGYHPWLGEGDPDKLLDILEAVGELAPRVLVPGHGPVGTPDSLRQMRHYVCALDELAREMADNGAAEAKIDAMMVPQPYDDWLFSAFFALNMQFLYERRLGA